MNSLLTTRHWESSDSVLSNLESPNNKVSQEFSKSDGNEELTTMIDGSENQENFNPARSPSSKRKQFKVPSKVATLAAPKAKFNKTDGKWTDFVKPSALLYEITERTNQLAQPRIRKNENIPLQHLSTISKIPKATPRILQLSQPKMIYEPPSNPIGHILPSALRAVATKRIIELSKPRRNRKTKPQRKHRKTHYTPCSSRIVYLSRPRQTNLQEKFKKPCEPHKDRECLKRLWQELTWCNARNAWKSIDAIRNRKKYRNSKKKKAPRRIRHLESSNSNRSIVTIDLSDYSTRRIVSRRRRS